MIPFAVKVQGLDADNKARWVLGIDAVGERLLVAHDDGSLHWHPLVECAVGKIISPEQPQMVIPVQLQENPLVMPNRAERRRMIQGNGLS